MARPSRTGGKKIEAKARNASPAKGRETTKTKRRIAPAATRAKRGLASGPSKDLKEAREQQAATAEILKVIASSPSDLQPVFDAIATSAKRLIGGFSTAVHRVIDDIDHLVAFTPTNPKSDEVLKAAFPRHRSEMPAIVSLVENGEAAQIVDSETADGQIRKLARARGWRSATYTPLMNQGTFIGFIVCTRRETGMLADHHVRLLRTFADQAVIAIENARLFNETQESLARQTAMAQILEVINSSPGDLKPVFDAVLERATRLCGAGFGVLSLYIGDDMHQVVAMLGEPPGFADMYKDPIHLGPGTGVGRLVRGESYVHIPDAADDEAYRSGHPVRRALVDIAGARTYLAVPIRRDDVMLGSFTIYRREVRLFSPEMIALLQSFAAQAAIAIDNARLFNETKEALERQTATADILKVIAISPDDVQPVFDAIAERSNRIVEGRATAVFSLADNVVHLMAFTPMGPEADTRLQASFPRPLSQVRWGEMIDRGTMLQTADLQDPSIPQNFRDLARLGGYRSQLVVPLLSEGQPIGAIAVTRAAPGKFADHHIQLLHTFSDQAVIAIQNVRLFKETQEALERQTATADILKVIASSPSDTAPVFEAIATTGHRLLGGFSTTVFSIVDDMLHLSAFTSTNPSADAALRAAFPRPVSTESWNHRVLNGETVEIPDVETDPVVPETLREMWRKRGFRSILLVPLVRSGKTIGMINTTRVQPGLFSSHHVQLLQAFADQAVIAIENTRLFNETREALEQQTATSEVLEIISSSPGDLDPVFQRMLENACRVCGASFGTMNLWNGEEFINAAQHNTPPAFAAFRQQTPIRPHPDTPMAKVVRTHRLVHEHDLGANPAYLAGVPNVVAIVNIAGARTILNVPMLKEDELIGTITIFRQEVRPFSDKQIALVENFTKQAVIAIENTRLLRELRERTDDLTRSLDDLRAAQDRLVQTEKLASLGQLTAGIAHEIKNPLNFVNNFSALSAELTDELNETLKAAALTDKMRDDVGELTKLLKENLEKVVQHGKRANSIVKNMLLHSREGSREHRTADINSLLDESLNLAYHGARAEKGEFNITLQRDFDADAGTIELFPQEITRAFLNLIANGVYAATKRKTEANEPGFEPTLRAATKNLGTTVEIRIRDNGTGIPVEVQEKMFNPFFTTKPAGEGTGLGLSMTHDIIVKQHGGRIDVATEPGQFTEFTIVLPRKSNLSDKDRGKT